MFTVLLPFEKTSQDRMEPGQANRELAASRDVLKALVADDDILNQQYVYQILQKNNFDVVLVDNGKLAIEKLSEERFDIIFMDIRMPVMNGVEAMESIRNDLEPPACNTPIIALTANAYESDIKRYYEAGATAYLAKPCRPELLMETVDDALREKSAIRA